MNLVKCEVCFRHCQLDEGQIGVCFARKNVRGTIVSENYGKITSLALDPIEKKPLSCFFPGSKVISVGSYGCNMKCPFCQNVEISLADGRAFNSQVRVMMPEELADLSLEYRNQGNIGIAYTYNEPLVGYEFVRDTAKLVHESGMKNILVTNGSVSENVLDQVGPYIDAMNIDLKCFRTEYYAEILHGDFSATKTFIKNALCYSHVELTTLIIPNENDSEEEMRLLAEWISDIGREAGKQIPLHVTRFFPRSKYSNRQSAEVEKVYRLAEIAQEYLEYVFVGNC